MGNNNNNGGMMDMGSNDKKLGFSPSSASTRTSSSASASNLFGEGGAM